MANLGRIARLAAEAAARGTLAGRQGSASGLGSALGSSGSGVGSGRVPAWLQHQGCRRMAGGGGHNETVTYEGLTMYKPLRWQVFWGEAMCGLMWFWILYRAYHDGETFIYGHAHEFEKELAAEAEGKAAHH